MAEEEFSDYSKIADFEVFEILVDSEQVSIDLIGINIDKMKNIE